MVNFMDGSGNSQKTKSGTEKRSQKLSKYDEKTFNKTRVIVKKRDRRTRVKIRYLMTTFIFQAFNMLRDMAKNNQ